MYLRTEQWPFSVVGVTEDLTSFVDILERLLPRFFQGATEYLRQERCQVYSSQLCRQYCGCETVPAIEELVVSARDKHKNTILSRKCLQSLKGELGNPNIGRFYIFFCFFPLERKIPILFDIRILFFILIRKTLLVFLKIIYLTVSTMIG